MIKPYTEDPWHRHTVSGVFRTILAGDANLFVADFLHAEDADFAITAAKHFVPALRLLRDMAIGLPEDDPLGRRAMEILAVTGALFFDHDHVRVKVSRDDHFCGVVISADHEGVHVQADDDGRVFLAPYGQVTLILPGAPKPAPAALPAPAKAKTAAPNHHSAQAQEGEPLLL